MLAKLGPEERTRCVWTAEPNPGPSEWNPGCWQRAAAFGIGNRQKATFRLGRVELRLGRWRAVKDGKKRLAGLLAGSRLGLIETRSH